MPYLSSLARDEYYCELRNNMPRTIPETEDAEARRTATAIAAFNALSPIDAYEGRLAVQIVLCGAHAAEALQEACVYQQDFAKRTRCRAQASSLMREGRGAERVLTQTQKHRLLNMRVAEAMRLAETPRPTGAQPAEQYAPPPPIQPAAAPPQPGPAPVPPAMPPLRVAAGEEAARPAEAKAARPAEAKAAPMLSAEAMALAEAFAQKQIVAAAQIRHDGGVTPRNQAYFRTVTFPSDPAVIDALVRGDTELLTVLDEVGAEALDEAA
jgi:hypothetical protein